MGRIKKIIGALFHAPERFDILAERIEQVHQAVVQERADRESAAPFIRQLQASNVLAYDQLDEKVAELNAAEESFVRRIAGRMAMDDESMKMLNRGIRHAPCVIGDQNRLHVKETASVGGCCFQLTSGSITVGEYFSAGANVSLIAEKVNIEMTGLHRQDHVPEGGCDISIGDGVYIGSGSMILGPCTIGKNAVVLPGSVVYPGTEISANSVWAGNPAGYVRDLDSVTEQNRIHAALIRMMDENQGILFLDGWSKEIKGWWNVPGRKMMWTKCRLLTDRKHWKMEYCLSNGNSGELKIEGPCGEGTIPLVNDEDCVSVSFPIRDGEAGEVSFMIPMEKGLTVALSPAETRRDA